MIHVVFTYDEVEELWKVSVHNASNEREALEAFCAVLHTCRTATPEIECNKAELHPDGFYAISVGIKL